MGAGLNGSVEWLSGVLNDKRLINQAFSLTLSGGAGGNRTTPLIIYNNGEYSTIFGTKYIYLGGCSYHKKRH